MGDKKQINEREQAKRIENSQMVEISIQSISEAIRMISERNKLVKYQRQFVGMTSEHYSESISFYDDQIKRVLGI